MTRNETPPEQNGGSGQWLKSNLSALGSATVFAVYAAGFVRTKAAAASLSDEPVRRVHTATLAPPSEATTATTSQTAPTVTPAAPATAPTAATATATASKPAAAPAQLQSKAVSMAAASSAATPAAAPTIAATPASTAAPAVTKAPTSAPLPAVTAAAVPAAAVAENAAPPAIAATTVAPIKAAPVTPTPSAPAPAPAPTANAAATTQAPTNAAAAAAPADAAPARVGFKDGTYTGYGRSNHGDIEATVDVVDGKIVDSYITKCLTEYSCSWIVALPPQVSQRQSAEVDIVSGATASSNAFYAAIRQALSKAK